MSDHVMVKTLGTQTITVNSTEENLSENVLVLGILWGGFFIATCTTGWHVFTSWKVAEGEGTSSGDTSRYLVRTTTTIRGGTVHAMCHLTSYASPLSLV